MPSKNSQMNANTNPPTHIIQVHIYEDSLDVINGWENWSLKDVIKILKNMFKKEYSLTGAEVDNILFYKLLEAVEDPNIPFEVIKETVHMALNSPSCMGCYNVFYAFYAIRLENQQVVCNFFKEFIKHGINDTRDYDLIYTMLTHRIGEGCPIGFEMGKKSRFNYEVLAKLILKMQKRLKSETYVEDNEDSSYRICYSLLTGDSIRMYRTKMKSL